MNLTPDELVNRLTERNPFATKYVRPGAIEYHFADTSSAADLVETLQRQNWRGEIVGPHGSGKSTLVQTLIPHLRAQGRDVRLFVLHAGESRLPVDATDLKSWGPATQIILDGYEQLGGWTRTLLQRICQRQECGVLVTSHQPSGWPSLTMTAPSLPLIQLIVREMQIGGPVRVHDHDVQLSCQKHGGNIREVFFELHDLYGQRRE